MSIKRYIVIFLFFFCQSVSGESGNKITVDNIYVIGNKVTDESVIIREMSHQIGGVLRTENLSFDRNRIYSLGLFNKVDINHYVNDDTATIVVEVHERWYIFPVPVFGIKDRDWSRLFYGFGVSHNNFRGLNQKLWAGFALGYDPWFSLYYRNPAMFGRNDIFLESEFIYTKTENKSALSIGEDENFDENRFMFDLGIGKRFNLFTTLGFWAGYRRVDTGDYVPGHTKSQDGVDEYLIGGMIFKYDSRDLIEYPMSGAFVQSSLFKSGFGRSSVNHWRAGVDLRGYQPFDREIGITFAGRIMTNITWGSRLPHHEHVFIGYKERIRGHFKTLHEGENIFLSSLETRFRLFGPKYLELKAVNIPGFSLLKYGLMFALFTDMGATWFREESLSDIRPVHGFGAGFHILLPYSMVVRIEYGFNESFDGEFIFDLYVMF